MTEPSTAHRPGRLLAAVTLVAGVVVAAMLGLTAGTSAARPTTSATEAGLAGQLSAPTVSANAKPVGSTPTVGGSLATVAWLLGTPGNAQPSGLAPHTEAALALARFGFRAIDVAPAPRTPQRPTVHGRAPPPLHATR